MHLLPWLNEIVTEPPLRLIDDQERDVGDRYYKSGSTIDLQCQISRSYLYKELQNILNSVLPHDIDRVDIAAAGAKNTVNDISTINRGNMAHSGTTSTTTTTTTIPNPTARSATTVTNSEISININKINAINSPINNHNSNINIQMNSYKGMMKATAVPYSVLTNKRTKASRTSSEDYYSNLLQFNGNQTDRQRELLEKQFNSLVFWAKDDEQLVNTARRRIIM